MKRYINLEAIIEGGFCLIFSGFMFYMAYSGKYLLFVTPRMKPYLYFTAVMLLIWAASRFKQAGKPKYKVHLSKCLVLVLPLMVMLLPYNAMASGTPKAQYTNVAGIKTPAGSLNSQEGKKQPGGSGGNGGGRQSGGSGQNAGTQQSGGSGQNAGTQQSGGSSQNAGTQQSGGSGQSTGTKQSGGSGQNVQMQQYTGPGQNTGQQQSGSAGHNAGGRQSSGSGQGGSKSDSGLKTKVPSGLDDANHTINVSDKEFYQWLVELSQHPEKYEGYEIQIHGTVFHDQTMAQNEFAVTRVLMSCCVADLADCGPICQWQGTADLGAGKWVDVTGKVHFDQTKGIEIIVEQIQDAQPAAEQYVYPFYYNK